MTLNYSVFMLSLNLSVISIAALINNPSLVVVITLILVSPAVRSAVFNITIPSYIFPSMSSYLIGESAVDNQHPWSAIIIRTVPVTIMVDVIPVPIVNDIIWTANGYRKALSPQINKTRW